MTSVPYQGEPDIYESLAEALIAASTAYLDADPYYEAGMTHLRQASELDQHSEELAVQAGLIMEQAYTLFSEYRALTDTDPQRNIDQARELMGRNPGTAPPRASIARGGRCVGTAVPI